jgi:hypothetical protein
MDFDVFLQRRLLVVAQGGTWRRFMTHDQLRSRHTEFTANVEELTPLLMPVRRLDHYATTRDAVEERVEFGRLRFNACRHRIGRLHVAVGNLHR